MNSDHPAPTEPRKEFLDFDARRDPKTDFYCCRCQQDLNRNKQCRWVFLADDMNVVHPDDAGQYEGKNYGWLPIGNDCATILGMEWTTGEPR